MLRQFCSGIRALLQKERFDREIDEEIEAYIDISAQEKMRTGMSREEAVRRARLELGGLERVKEDVRSVGWEVILEELWKDAAYALRSLRRNPTFSIVAIVALTLGIGANTAIFTVVRGVLLRPLPFPEPDRLMLAAYYAPSAFAWTLVWSTSLPKVRMNRPTESNLSTRRLFWSLT